MDSSYPNAEATNVEKVRNTIDVIVEIRQRLKELNARKLSANQISLIIRRKMQLFTTKWNEMLSQKIADDHLFVDGMDKIAQTLRTITNSLPNNDDYDSLRLQMQSIFNFCYILISFREGEKAMFKIQGTANMLATILSGIETLDDLNLPSTSDPNYLEHLERVVTYLFSTQLMLLSVIDAIPVINNSMLNQWVKKIVLFQSQLKEVTDSINLELLGTRFYNMSESQFYSNVEILHQWQFHLVNGTTILQKILGTSWVDEIPTKFLSGDQDPIFVAIDKANDDRHKILSELNDLYEQGVIDTNAPPSEAKELQYSRNFQEFDEALFRRYKFYKQFSQNSPSALDTGNLIMEGKMMQKGLENADSDPDIMFKPEDIRYYVENIDGLVSLIGLHSTITHTGSGLRGEIERLFSDAKLIEIEDYPLLQFWQIQVELFAFTHLGESFDTTDMVSRLQNIRNEIHHAPREYVTSLLLETCILMESGSIDDELYSLLEEGKSYLSASGFNHLIDPYQSYRRYLQSIIDGNALPEFSEPKINYLDTRSWLLPKFQMDGHEFVFYPFNMESQKVVS